MVEVLERGDVAFFWRPKVHAAGAPVAPPTVQRFFLILSPAGGGHRRLRIGRKRLPEATGQRFWANVERVGSLDRVLADQLEEERYPTRTRGERVQPGARPIGRGSYAFVRHDDHTHLAYRLEEREPDDELPDEVRVATSASYLVLYERRPRTRATWTTEGHPSALDEVDAEIVLVGTRDDVEQSLGIDLLAA